MFTIQGEPISVGATVLEYFNGIPITNTMTMAVFNLFLILVLCIIASRFTVRNPSKFQLLIENLIQLITGLIDQIAGDKKISWKITPIVSTLIIFILFSNLILLFLPILTGFTYQGQPMFRSHTNDFNTTVALSFGMIVISQMYSISTKSIFGYIFSYIQIPQVVRGFSKGIGEGFLALINFFVGLLDIVAEIAKIISLSLRLFGNMFAGELLTGVLMSMFAIALPIPIIALSLLSGTIQAIVFGSLVATFFTISLKEV